MTAPLVSVIVPAFRHAGYVRDCLRSVGDQTHSRLELIFVDDASPDETFALAEDLMRTAFATRFERVALHRKPTNAGAHDSLNIALAQASGDYVAILNSDDLYRPQRIELLLDALRATEGEFAFSGVETMADEAPGEPTYPESLILLRLRQRLNIAGEVSVGYALLRRNVAISTGNFFFSRRLANEIGGFAPLKYCHDWDFILRALLKTEPVFVDETLYNYRLHPDNAFRSLHHLAEAESEIVLRRFFKAVIAGEARNPRCPRPDDGTQRFAGLLSQAGYRRHWANEGGPSLDGAPKTAPFPLVRTPRDAVKELAARGSSCQIDHFGGAGLAGGEAGVSAASVIVLIGWLNAPGVLLTRSLPIFLRLMSGAEDGYLAPIEERYARPDVASRLDAPGEQMHGFKCAIAFGAVQSGRYRLQFLIGSVHALAAVYVVSSKITFVVG